MCQGWSYSLSRFNTEDYERRFQVVRKFPKPTISKLYRSERTEPINSYGLQCWGLSKAASIPASKDIIMCPKLLPARS